MRSEAVKRVLVIGAGAMGESISYKRFRRNNRVRRTSRFRYRSGSGKDRFERACFGFRLACLGPLEIHDLNGLDVVFNSWRQTRPTLCNDTAPSASVAEKVERGELGAKTGKGWHDYHGKSREEILAESNEKLLHQLALFRSLQKQVN